MALDVSEMCYRPDFAQHVPGVSNVMADSLSRVMQPDNEHEIPSVFANVTRDRLYYRGKKFFRTLSFFHHK